MSPDLLLDIILKKWYYIQADTLTVNWQNNNIILGCSQAVRHQTLTLAFRRSESCHPNQKSSFVRMGIFTFSLFTILCVI